MKRACILVLCILTLQAYTGNLYVSKGNIFAGAFNNLYESCFFILNDGEVYEFTTHDKDRIEGHLSVWVGVIEKDGYDIKDVVIIMHNHFASRTFSEADKKTYTLLKMYGFTGSFGIYVTATDKVYLIKG